MGVTLDLGGLPVGRLMLGNGRRRLSCPRIALAGADRPPSGQPLQNLFLLRHIRAHAIEASAAASPARFTTVSCKLC